MFNKVILIVMCQIVITILAKTTYTFKRKLSIGDRILIHAQIAPGNGSHARIDLQDNCDGGKYCQIFCHIDIRMPGYQNSEYGFTVLNSKYANQAGQEPTFRKQITVYGNPKTDYIFKPNIVSIIEFRVVTLQDLDIFVENKRYASFKYTGPGNFEDAAKLILTDIEPKKVKLLVLYED